MGTSGGAGAWPRGVDMAGLGWQELVILVAILGILVVTWVVPVWLIARETRPRDGTALKGCVISSIVPGWVAVLLWFMFGRRHG